MTPAQHATLANDILVTNAAALQAFVDAVDDQSIAEWYNTDASPAVWVYITALSKATILQGTSEDGTTFTWVGNGFITRSVGELMAWQELFSLNGTVDAAKSGTRQAFLDIFSGAGNAALNRTHLAAIARRRATRLEKLFATGTGSTAAPATMTLEGALTYLDVARALRNVGV